MLIINPHTIKSSWIAISLILVVVFGGYFNPIVAVASEIELEDVVVEEEKAAEAEIVETEPKQAVEVEEEVDEVIKDIENLKDKTAEEGFKTEDVESETASDVPVDNLEVEVKEPVENNPEPIAGSEETEVGTDEGALANSTTNESKTENVTVEDNKEVVNNDIEFTPLDNYTDEGVEGISAEYGHETDATAYDEDPEVEMGLESISAEYGNQTTSGGGGDDDTDEEVEEVSGEYNFDIVNETEPALEEEVSREYTLNTMSDIGQEEVSSEYSFTTSSGGGGGGGPTLEEEISDEYSFRTLSDTIEIEEEVSQEYSFTTDNGGGPTLEEEISNEYSFTTSSGGGGGGGPTLEEEISDEYSFRTLSSIGQEEVSSEYSFTTSSGGGGGGGGGRRTVEDIVLPTKCLPLILEYIRLGHNNNPIEVFKLQWFLRTFESLDVPLSGVYDEVTYEAVKIFQTRHADPILTSWGINEPTGYVFISTSLNINYIYCGIEGVQFDLRNFYQTTGTPFIKAPTKGSGAEYLILPPPIQSDASDRYMILETDLPAEIAIKQDGLLQVAMVGVIDFFSSLGLDLKTLKSGIWWLLVGLILIIILLILNKLNNRNNELKGDHEPTEALDDKLKEDELEELVEEYNSTIEPEIEAGDVKDEAKSGQVEHISETLKDRVIELEGKNEDKK